MPDVESPLSYHDSNEVGFEKRTRSIVVPNYGKSNLTMTKAPVRVSFFGGGTDYPEYFKEHGGAVLATAIDKYSYVTANTFLSKLFDYKVRVSYREVELVKNVADIKHGVFRECLDFLNIDRDIELHNVADLPAFSGLGSSSTFTVSLLQALHAYKGDIVKGIQLAYEAIHVERNLLKDNVGCQDQTMAAVGGFNVLEFLAEDDIKVHRIPISQDRIRELESHLMLVFTNITRRASHVVEGQLKRVSKNELTLKAMRSMVDTGYAILTSNTPITQFGELLHKAWVAKQSLATNVSNDKINLMYKKARENGAIGGKLLGAGGGGFLLLFARPEVHGKLRSTFSEQQIVDVKLNAQGSEIVL